MSTINDRLDKMEDSREGEGNSNVLISPFDQEEFEALPTTDHSIRDGRGGQQQQLLQNHRRNQASETLEEKVCKFFLDLNATAAPRNPNEYDLHNGIVFRLRTKNVGVAIKTLELDLKEFESTEVKVFTKIGEYNATGNVFEHPDSWEQVTTDTAFAVATAEKKNCIIPAEEFKTISMEPKESRLIYVALPSDSPLLKSAKEGLHEFDEGYARTNELVTHVGYAVAGPELFGNAIKSHPFHGIVHYETKLPCEDQRGSFSMDLPYFVDKKDPPVAITSLTNHAIINAVSHAMSRDAKLIRMQNIGGLRFQSTSTETNVVPYEGACPFGWSQCSKLVVTVNFGHDDRLAPGLVHYEVLRFATDYNVSSAGFELGYVGKMPLSLDYFITLVGAPKTFEFDHAQEAYYGTQTAKFLADMTGEEILAAGLTPTKRNKPDDHLRDNERRGSRFLQSTSAKVHTAIYGAYPAWPEPQHPHSVRGVDSMATVETLQTAFDENGTLYVQYIKDGLLRPGPINEENRGDFFAGITGIDAELDESSLWMPTAAPTPAPTFDPNAEEEVWGMPKSTLKVLAILLLIIGVLLGLFTCYWEFQERQAEKEKLKRNARAAQRKVDKLRAEQYRRIAEKKKKIQDSKKNGDDDDDAASLTEPMIT